MRVVAASMIAVIALLAGAVAGWLQRRQKQRRPGAVRWCDVHTGGGPGSGNSE
jgi:hypothetical protein